jgi:redox-sensitive bicupin YhaK (pirin superfamily)
VQAMRAGTGIRHSERNDDDSPARLFQIWLRPTASGGVPKWGNSRFRRPIGPAGSSCWRVAGMRKARCRFGPTER